MWSTDLVETIEHQNRVSQTAQCLYSGKECHESRRAHVHELPGARRRAVDVDDAKVVLEYQEVIEEVIDQPLDDQTSHVSP